MSLPSTPRIIPLTSDQASLALAGGKGASLARMLRSGLPVPDGFLVTTHAYQAFTSANHLDRRIGEILADLPLASDPETLEEISSNIRSLFEAGDMPPGLEDEIREAYDRLGQPPVAVRSSATAEDLPDLSFAGQQDTFLNVVGSQELLKAVVRCWSSLWTARAIGYRARNEILLEGLSLAVVVQRMVDSRAAGVLFTANPVTGLRTEMVIDAMVGLGEALVSGKIEPDHYVVDVSTGQITDKTLGAKAVSVRSQAGGGTTILDENAGEIQALPDEQILALVGLGQRTSSLFGSPQDIEWAWAEGGLYLLQSRPITSLYPLPEGMQPEPLKVMFSFGAVQGMLDPITPLGQDVVFQVFSSGARLVGIRLTHETQTILYLAGERLWVNITPLLRNSVGRKVVPIALSLVEPSVHQAIFTIWDDPRLQPTKRGLSFSARRQLAYLLVPLSANVLLNLLAPNMRRKAIVARGERLLRVFRERCAVSMKVERHARLAHLADGLPDLSDKELPRTLILLISAVASGVASLNLVSIISGSLSADKHPNRPLPMSDLVLEITRGSPFNPTTEMDLALWQVAQTIKQDPPSLDAFSRLSAAGLSTRFMAGDLPPVAQRAFTQFLEKYGLRGFAEFDIGRPRWQEDPTHVFDVVAGYLRIEDERQSPEAVFQRSLHTSKEALAKLLVKTRLSRLGWLKAGLLRFAANRVRTLMGMREYPKFFLVRLIGILREQLLEVGREFAHAGELELPDDLFYLTFSELGAFASGEKWDWQTLITQRRGSYWREMHRRQVPRLLLSDGRAFYQGIGHADEGPEILLGSPVSPGSVEGRVRVVFDPRNAHLMPGEIMVCRGTDPSWTPLFLSAAGLVMEVGGMMTHGAVVAREYGIPAVVGVDQATRRLLTGQRIRLDGSSGQIIILTEEDHPGSPAAVD